VSREFHITDDGKIRGPLRRKLLSSAEIITYDADPSLASLCTSIALKFELGRSEYDRLSSFWGVDIRTCLQSPYQIEVILDDQYGFGIRLRLADSMPFKPRSSELKSIIAPQSLDEAGHLSQLIIFPAMVARQYRNLGFQLVIVRDWILQTALSESEDLPLNYLVANEWEMENSIAIMQAMLMKNCQIPFFGTHDIVDHLFGAKMNGYLKSRDLVNRCLEVFDDARNPSETLSRKYKTMSYLLGVILDDLAQPKWYGSVRHIQAAWRIIQNLDSAKDVREIDDMGLDQPSKIARFVADFRNEGGVPLGSFTS
jgi:hypothetical protein